MEGRIENALGVLSRREHEFRDFLANVISGSHSALAVVAVRV